MRGPFSSLYGNAAGGVIQIFTADGPPEPTLSGGLYAGSYDTWKLSTQFGGTSGRLNYIGDLSRFQTDGYRDHSWARRDQLNAKFKYDAGRPRRTHAGRQLPRPAGNAGSARTDRRPGCAEPAAGRHQRHRLQHAQEHRTDASSASPTAST